MFGIYILVVSVLACLAVGGLVVSKGFDDKKTQIYGLLTLFLVVLSVMNYIAVEYTENQLASVRAVMVSATFAVYLLYLLVVSLKNRRKKFLFYKTPFFYITILVALLDITDLLFSGVIAGSPPTPIPGPGISLFFIHLIVAVILSIRLLYHDIKHARTSRDRLRYRPLIAGILPIALLAPFTSFILPILGYDKLVVVTPLYILIFVTFVGYSILRHGLLDVKQTVTRTFAYVLTLATLGVAYFGIAYFITNIVFQSQVQRPVEQDVANVTLMLLLALFFQPVKKVFDRVTNFVFFRDSYDPNEFFSRLTDKLSSNSDIYNLLNYTVTEISSTLKAEFGAFSVYRGDDTRPIFVSTKKRAFIPIRDIEAINMHVQETDKSVILTSDLTDPEDAALRRLLISHHINLVLPVLHEGAVNGFLFLGAHLSSHFAKRDIQTLETVAGELAIAIQNALTVEKFKELNSHLEQRIDAATKELRRSNAQLQRLDEAKDDFISMASHQLRTPLTSIKGYISMMIDGDFGKITTDQQQVLNEAYMSSERMVHLIGDFLNVSRLQTGKFVIEKHPVDLAVLVQREIDGLKQNAMARNMQFEFTPPKNLPMFSLDENKIEQVVMNFSDNALYYSKENSKIVVTLKKVGDHVEFVVKDKGIGVPEDEQSHLFNKFFRATNARRARPDGTGVGLFLAKKVIDEHDGSVIFESKEGKGSSFGFKLPLPK